MLLGFIGSSSDGAQNRPESGDWCKPKSLIFFSWLRVPHFCVLLCDEGECAGAMAHAPPLPMVSAGQLFR